MISVDLRQGAFTAKLSERKESHNRLRERITICQNQNSEPLRELLLQIAEACGHQDGLLAKYLREKETITGGEFMAILSRK